MGSGGDDDQVPAGLLHSLDLNLKCCLGLLEFLNQQLLLDPAGLLHGLDFHLVLGPGLLELPVWQPPLDSSLCNVMS